MTDLTPTDEQGETVRVKRLLPSGKFGWVDVPAGEVHVGDQTRIAGEMATFHEVSVLPPDGQGERDALAETIQCIRHNADRGAKMYVYGVAALLEELQSLRAENADGWERVPGSLIPAATAEIARLNRVVAHMGEREREAAEIISALLTDRPLPPGDPKVWRDRITRWLAGSTQATT